MKKTETQAATERLRQAHEEQRRAGARLQGIREERAQELEAGNLERARKLRHDEGQAEADLSDADRLVQAREAQLSDAQKAAEKAGRIALEAQLVDLEQRAERADAAIVEAAEAFAASVRARRELSVNIATAYNALTGASGRPDDVGGKIAIARLLALGVIDSRELVSPLRAFERFDPVAQAEEAKHAAEVEAGTRRSEALAAARELVADAERIREGWSKKIANAITGHTGHADEHRADLAAFEARVAAAEDLIENERAA